MSCFLQQQEQAIPAAVPSGMVIDPTTNLVWALASSNTYRASTTGACRPQVSAQCDGGSQTLTLIPDLLNTVNAADSRPDPGPTPD